ncbi:MAG: hypothetical protein R3Y05_01495 [bacterium]
MLNKLKEMLQEVGIEYHFGSNPNEQITILDNLNEKMLISVIFKEYSYGYKDNLLEIMGGLTEYEYLSDCVVGYLTADNVFKRIKYCIENKTDIYVEEEVFEVGDKVYYIPDTKIQSGKWVNPLYDYKISIQEDKNIIGCYRELKVISHSKKKCLEYIYVEKHKEIERLKKEQEELLKEINNVR